MSRRTTDFQRLTLFFAAVLLTIGGLWLVSLAPGALAASFWTLRETLIYGAGVLALGSMSITVILASRPVWIEGMLGGLDKFYRLHKWFAIAALSFAVTHWLLEVVPRSLAQRGWIARPQRPPAAAEPVIPAGFDPFRDLEGIAVQLAEWSLYLVLALAALALWKRFPYRAFLKTHRLMPAIYLVLLFHAIIMIDRSYWTAPLGPVLALLMLGGAVAAVSALVRRTGVSRKAVGRIQNLTPYEGNAVLDVEVRLETAWPGHRAGQFAFVNLGGVEGAHPFTIASAWRRDGRLTFSIKGLGDYTRRLPDHLFVGQAVTVEGPYGRFDFRDAPGRQVWIAGGVGITPFIARLQALADQRLGLTEADAVDLVYSTSAPDEAFIETIRRLAERAGVRFHLLVTPRDGLLTLDRLADRVSDWKDAGIWFCGPAPFGQAIRRAMMARGLPATRFHQESFQMR